MASWIGYSIGYVPIIDHLSESSCFTPLITEHGNWATCGDVQVRPHAQPAAAAPARVTAPAQPARPAKTAAERELEELEAEMAS